MTPPRARRDANAPPDTDCETFREALRAAVARARDGLPHTLFVVDVERLAEARAACGPAIDGALDALVDATLCQQAGTRSPPYRLAVDRFALVQERCRPADALIIARRMRGALGGGVLRWNDLSFRLGARVSAVELGAPAIAGADEALALALEALTTSERLGDDGVSLVAGTREERLAVDREIRWREHLREVM